MGNAKSLRLLPGQTIVWFFPYKTLTGSFLHNRGIKSFCCSIHGFTYNFFYQTYNNFRILRKDATNENVLRRTREDDSMINKVDNTSSFRRTGIVAQLDYNRTFGKHGVSALAFYEQYESNDEMVLPTRFQSVNGWFGYNYDKKYGIDVIGAYQGSHKFGPGHKFGFFPTISAGWTVSNESFWKDAKK